jgi:hypothetical protein
MSTSVEFTPRPRSEIADEPERRRDRALAVGGDAAQHLLDRLLAGLLDVVAVEDLHRRRGLGVGALDARAGHFDAL